MRFVLYGRHPEIDVKFPSPPPGFTSPQGGFGCPDFNNTTPCTLDITVPKDSDIIVKFPALASAYQWPVRVREGEGRCDQHQSVKHAVWLAEGQGKDASLQCTMQVSANAVAAALWRSGAKWEFCTEAPRSGQNAPTPTEATLWVWSVADFPSDIPDAPTHPAQPYRCGDLPPSHSDATKDG